MKTLIIIFLNFKISVFRIRLNCKIRKAERLKNRTRANYLILTDGYKMRVYRRSELRFLIKTKKFKGYKTIEQLENKAIYTTR